MNPYDVHSIAKALQTLLLDDELCKKMGEKARQHVLSNFTIDRMVKNLEETFKLILEDA